MDLVRQRCVELRYALDNVSTGSDGAVASFRSTLEVESLHQTPHRWPRKLENFTTGNSREPIISRPFHLDSDHCERSYRRGVDRRVRVALRVDAIFHERFFVCYQQCPCAARFSVGLGICFVFRDPVESSRLLDRKLWIASVVLVDDRLVCCALVGNEEVDESLSRTIRFGLTENRRLLTALFLLLELSQRVGDVEIVFSDHDLEDFVSVYASFVLPCVSLSLRFHFDFRLREVKAKFRAPAARKKYSQNK
jgi:hypothetical protein